MAGPPLVQLVGVETDSAETKGTRAASKLNEIALQFPGLKFECYQQT